MKFDLPEGFEELLGGFGGLPDYTKPIMPKKWMTIEQLIKCSEHNAKVANEIAKKKTA